MTRPAEFITELLRVSNEAEPAIPSDEPYDGSAVQISMAITATQLKTTRKLLGWCATMPFAPFAARWLAAPAPGTISAQTVT